MTNPPPRTPAGGVDPARLIAAHHTARDFYRAQLLAADQPRGYLTRRGFGILTRPHQPWAPGVDRPWDIGYAPPGWTNLTRHLTAHGYRPEEILAAGLATRNRDGRLVDLFRDRLMFPIHNADGDPVAFLGRASPAAGSSAPKYLNTPDTDIFHKGQTLYGAAEQAGRIAAGWAPVIVEGPLDVLAVWLAHPKAVGVGRVAVGTCGTNLTAHHAAAVYAMPGAVRHGVTTAFDPDEAGQAATTRAWRILPLYPDIALRAAVLPDGCDPADLIVRPAGLATLRGALTHQARPLVHVVLDQHLARLTTKHPDLLDHIEGRLAAARSLAAHLTDLEPDQVLGLVERAPLPATFVCSIWTTQDPRTADSSSTAG